MPENSLSASSATAAKKPKSVKKRTSAAYFRKRKSLLMLSRDEVATRLGCSPMTILRWEKQGRLIPFRFAHNMVRYRIEDVTQLEQEARG